MPVSCMSACKVWWTDPVFETLLWFSFLKINSLQRILKNWFLGPTRPLSVPFLFHTSGKGTDRIAKLHHIALIGNLEPCEVMTFCKYLDDTRKSDSFNQVNEVKSFGKCKWLPGMCPHRFGCILPHGGGPSSQCKIDAPIFCPEYVRFVIKFAKGAHYWSKLNWGEWACWTVGGQLALPPLHRSTFHSKMGPHFHKTGLKNF